MIYWKHYYSLEIHWRLLVKRLPSGAKSATSAISSKRRTGETELFFFFVVSVLKAVTCLNVVTDEDKEKFVGSDGKRWNEKSVIILTVKLSIR